MDRHNLWIAVDKYKRRMFLKKELKRVVLKSIKLNKNTTLSRRYLAAYLLSKQPRFSASTFSNFQFLVPDFNTFTGSFQVTAIEYSGTYNDAVQYSMSFESAGAVTIATV